MQVTITLIETLQAKLPAACVGWGGKQPWEMPHLVGARQAFAVQRARVAEAAQDARLAGQLVRGSPPRDRDHLPSTAPSQRSYASLLRQHTHVHREAYARIW